MSGQTIRSLGITSTFPSPMLLVSVRIAALAQVLAARQGDLAGVADTVVLQPLALGAVAAQCLAAYQTALPFFPASFLAMPRRSLA
ncbi:MAG TPA: hypothetical protein VKR06_39030 [Ktedonosporobacter sp.]|nr:hypothetical protein [Ktedonosporobacter sp.]